MLLLFGSWKSLINPVERSHVTELYIVLFSRSQLFYIKVN